MAGDASSVWRDAVLVARKDLLIEARTRVAVNQVAPFAVLVLLLFAFAFDSSTRVLREGTPGLFWIAVLLSGLLAVQRAFSLEAPDGLRDALRLSGLHPAGIFLGKVASVALQLLVLDLLLGLGVVALYDARLGAPALLVPSVVVATLGLAAVGCLYGVLSVGQRVASTLLPLLMLPALAPLLLCATQAVDAALSGTSGEGWRWLLLLVAFTGSYLALGAATFGILLDDS
ncbi:ABC transporter permease [Iamia sp. SCSIO 61187]|uniref:heme exporter protein CcmB n=1 Tax=Iamia sp. SCSIO 61187 TaxID=2722752 RepID=UPI001C6310CF|nr:heme exporter protein CcmB [Iamia sp. SCSIO 61187]QYG91507.1 ABC transporter permease [Iamia sp. SCSIO 61187]